MNNMRRKLASMLACLSSFSSLTTEAVKRNVKPKIGGAKTNINSHKLGVKKYKADNKVGARKNRDIKKNNPAKPGNKSYALRGLGESKTKSNGWDYWPLVYGGGGGLIGFLLGGLIFYNVGKKKSNKTIIVPTGAGQNPGEVGQMNVNELNSLNAQLNQLRTDNMTLNNDINVANSTIQKAMSALGCNDQQVFCNYLKVVEALQNVNWGVQENVNMTDALNPNPTKFHCKISGNANVLEQDIHFECEVEYDPKESNFRFKFGSNQEKICEMVNCNFGTIEFYTRFVSYFKSRILLHFSNEILQQILSDNATVQMSAFLAEVLGSKINLSFMPNA